LRERLKRRFCNEELPKRESGSVRGRRRSAEKWSSWDFKVLNLFGVGKIEVGDRAQSHMGTWAKLNSYYSCSYFI
jgi:hypothetical protein